MEVSAIAPSPSKITQVSRNHHISGFGSSRNGKVNTRSKSKRWTVSWSVSGDDLCSERRVSEVMVKQAALFDKKQLQRFSSTEEEPKLVLPPNLTSLNQAYDLCRQEASMHKDNTFYLGTLFMKPEQRRAFWAMGVWGKRIDELVDGPNASSEVSPSDLDIWDSRLEQIFEGRPGDAVEAVLADSVSRFHLDIQPFKDLIEGMRMDITKTIYTNFEELSLYCYHVAGSVCLISLQIFGTAPESQATTESLFRSALAFGTACQLTNILRDVGEDARRGRVYLPQDELAEAGLSEEDIFSGEVTDKWRSFMKQQIQRTRIYFEEAEKILPELNATSRWVSMASLLLYRQILDEIVANDYNNFTKRARASKPKKFLTLAIAYARSMLLTPSKSNIMSP